MSNIKFLNKSQENFHVKYYKNFDISEIKKYINDSVEFQVLEEEYKRRELNPESPLDGIKNAYMNVLPVTLNSVSFEDFHNNVLKITKTKNDLAWSLINPIVKDLEEFIDGVCGEVSFNNLLANKDIHGHYDNGLYYEVMRRFHVPIFTNKDTWFIIEKSKVIMSEGQCWEINNAKYHSVHNKSNENRIHLVIDIIPNKIIKKGNFDIYNNIFL